MGDISDQLEQTHSCLFGDDHVWMTNDGQVLTLEEISDAHLLNIIPFLKCQYSKTLDEGYGYIACISGEHALEAAESQLDQELQAYLNQIEFFTAEARKRNLTLKG